VARGGGVLGLCGGAALMAQVKQGWGLLAVERYSGKVPTTMHGPIWIKPEASDHPLWYGYSSRGVPLAPWFGKAFQPPLSDEVRVLGRYDRPTDDFYIAHELNGNYFNQYLPEELGTLDEVYDGLANPAILKGLVAMVEGEYGAGKIIIGYPHPETPGVEGGFLLLANAIYHVATSPPVEDSPWLPSPGEKSYRETEVLSLLEAVKDIHSSLVLPAAKDLVSFGTNNLYWTPRPHIPWCYIAEGGYSFHVCERLEIYGDEILRQLEEIPHLISEINNKRESLLALAEQPQVKDGLKRVTERLDGVYRLSGAALSEIQETYRSRIEASLADWVTNYKRILLYRQLLAIMKVKDADSALVSDVTRKDKELSSEYVGSWRWAQASEKNRNIFVTLDTASYRLSNLKFELRDISLALDYFLLTGSE
jgi:hypothetical protein